MLEVNRVYSKASWERQRNEEETESSEHILRLHSCCVNGFWMCVSDTLRVSVVFSEYGKALKYIM